MMEYANVGGGQVRQWGKVFGLACVLALFIPEDGKAQDAAPDLPADQVEQIVRDYLMREPEII